MVSKESRRLQEILTSKPATNDYTWRFINKNRNLRLATARHPAASRVTEACRLPLTGMPRRRFRRMSDKMLQTVQKKYPTRRVFSLYCVWTTRDGSANSPLIAVWIDPSMRGFEDEIAVAAESECTELSSEEPGSSLIANGTSEPELATELESFPL
jgi:hypothetical protein